MAAKVQVVFLPIFVAVTKIIYGYDFEAPLNFIRQYPEHRGI